jgi:hypothetical protein
MKYYDLKRQWPRVRPHLSDPKVASVLVRDFHKFTYGRWGRRFLLGMRPHEFESRDWWCGHRGRMPAFWWYTKHAACHWLVNFNLELALASVCDRKWRILTSPKHSTVWDGEDTLFDFNFSAIQISPEECFQMARKRELRPGQHKRVYFAQHWRADPDRR